MKQLSKFILLIVTALLTQNSKAERHIDLENKTTASSLLQPLQDTAFYGSYIAAGKETYVYSKPNLTSKTRTKMPENVALSVTKKSGDFVFGKFNVSSNKSFAGWFRLADLKLILFTAPKTN